MREVEAKQSRTCLRCGLSCANAAPHIPVSTGPGDYGIRWRSRSKRRSKSTSRHRSKSRNKSKSGQEPFPVRGEFITLGQLLKAAGAIDSGGAARPFLAENPV